MAVYTHCCRAQPLRQLGFLVDKCRETTRNTFIPRWDYVRIVQVLGDRRLLHDHCTQLQTGNVNRCWDCALNLLHFVACSATKLVASSGQQQMETDCVRLPVKTELSIILCTEPSTKNILCWSSDRNLDRCFITRPIRALFLHLYCVCLFMTWAGALWLVDPWIYMTRRRVSTRRKSRHVRFRTRLYARWHCACQRAYWDWESTLSHTSKTAVNSLYQLILVKWSVLFFSVFHVWRSCPYTAA